MQASNPRTSAAGAVFTQAEWMRYASQFSAAEKAELSDLLLTGFQKAMLAALPETRAVGSDQIDYIKPLRYDYYLKSCTHELFFGYVGDPKYITSVDPDCVRPLPALHNIPTARVLWIDAREFSSVIKRVFLSTNKNFAIVETANSCYLIRNSAPQMVYLAVSSDDSIDGDSMVMTKIPQEHYVSRYLRR